MPEPLGYSVTLTPIEFDGSVVTLANGAEEAIRNRNAVIARAERRRKLRIASVVADRVIQIHTAMALLPMPELEFCPHCGQVMPEDDI